jgi:predicted RecB family nuclease
MSALKKLRTCPNGHKYYKTTDCPACPVCENERRDNNSSFGILGAPARRALENAGITTITELARYSEKDILKLHGMGPGSMPKLRGLLQEQGLSFKSA